MTGSRCRECGRDVLWARTPAGKHMPLDPERRTEGEGNLAVCTDHQGVLRVRVLAKDALPLRPWEWIGIAHFATCEARLAQRDKLPGVRSLDRARTKRKGR